MIRIAGVNIPENKRIEIALTYIHGLGRSLSSQILKQARINPDIRAIKLDQDQVNLLRNLVEKQKIEGELRREKIINIKRLKDIGAWRGTRHAKGLPVRGQTTQKNSRTVRGNIRKTTLSGKRKMEKT